MPASDAGMGRRLTTAIWCAGRPALLTGRTEKPLLLGESLITEELEVSNFTSLSCPGRHLEYKAFLSDRRHVDSPIIILRCDHRLFFTGN